MYHYSRVEPLFYDDEKLRKLLLLLHVLFLVDIYGAKVIIAVRATGYIFLFLSYSVMYSYVSFLMRLIEIIKTLILLFILLHLYGVAITRIAEGCTPLLWLQLLLLLVL